MLKKNAVLDRFRNKSERLFLFLGYCKVAEKLNEQMKGLSLETDKIVGKCLDTEINFCLSVDQRFAESGFEQPIGLKFVYGKILITLFFLSEKRLSAPDAGTICTVAEECFSKEMSKLGWCTNYKIEQERAVVGDFKYRLMFSYINHSRAHWGRNDDVSKEDLCNCIMCEPYV